MKKFNFILLFFVFAFCFHSVRSQCCCSEVRLSLVDKKGNQLEQSKVKLKEITDRKNELSRVFFYGSETNKSDVFYRMGCASGKEVLSLSYKGSEMKIHFRLK